MWESSLEENKERMASLIFEFPGNMKLCHVNNKPVFSYPSESNYNDKEKAIKPKTRNNNLTITSEFWLKSTSSNATIN